MFLSRLIEKNAALPSAAIRLHQQGRVPANTYLLDLDTFTENARVLKQAADAEGLALYFMSKQFGRNPDACRAIRAAGVSSAVCVDLQDMEAVERSDTPIGHVGHLVQPHRGTERAVIDANPDVVTVFTLEIAKRLGSAALALERTQRVLLRVAAPGDVFYFGHGGGFPLDGIEKAAESIEAIEGLTVAGVTTFPALLANPETRRVEPTHNFKTLRQAADRLRDAGFQISQVNAPGTTSAGTMAQLREGGATHVEPGNAFHGTTPQMVFDPEASELPAVVYVSEISHLDGNEAYVFGAGLYIDKLLGDYELRVLCGRDEGALERVFPAEMAPDGAIHYYCIVHLPTGHRTRVGDTVVFCFRPQVFVTRARTQGVAGLRSGRIEVRPQYDVEARRVEGVS
jgi:predicted amino acid racemase